MDVRIQAVFIASSVTFLGIILKDILYPIIIKSFEEKNKNKEVYRIYAEPLAKSAESFFWRLNEVLNVPGRAKFLIREEPSTEFDDYKYLSTLYRFATLLGWIQAIKKEQSFIRSTNSKTTEGISKALLGIESALADGPHVEEERLKRLVELWELECSPQKTPSLAIELSNLIRSELTASGHRLVSELPAIKVFGLCDLCAKMLCKELNHDAIPESKIRDTQFDVAKKLSIKEAWLYRDWQSAIGDFMLECSNSEQRLYDVKGYKEFESIYYLDDTESKKWIKRLARCFENLYIYDNKEQDIRIAQLEKVFNSVSKLISSIHKSELTTSPFTEETIKKIDKH